MANARAPGDESPATYEIRLVGTPANDLLERFDSLIISTGRERAETVLFRQVEEPSELDALLDRVLSMGIVLTEVHELPLMSERPMTSSPDIADGEARSP